MAGSNQEHLTNSSAINRNVVLLGIVSFLNDVSSEMLAPVLPIFLTNVLSASKIASGSVMGLIESFSSLFKVVFGYISDRMRRRRLFVFVGYTISAISKGSLAFVVSIYDFLAARTLDRVGKGIRTSPRDAIIAESSKQTGKSFGFHRMLDTLGAVAGPVAAIIILSIIGSSEESIRTLFLISVIPCLAGLGVLTFVRETGREITKVVKRISALRSRSLHIFLIAVIFASLGRYSYAFTIWRAEELGFTAVQSIAFYAVFNLIYGLSAYPVGMYSDRVGKKVIAAAGFGLFALTSLLFAYSYDLVTLSAAFMLFGICMAIEDTIPRAYMADLAGEVEKGTVIGMYHTVYGFCVFPASLIVAFFWQNLGLAYGFMYAAVMNILAMLILLVFRTERALINCSSG
jgi:MFS family permease